MSPEKQKQKASETLDVFCPLAEQLGLWSIKTKLEDLAFPYLYPNEFLKLQVQVAEDPRVKPENINAVMTLLNNKVTQLGLKEQIHFEIRTKGYYSLYMKIQSQISEGSPLAGIEHIEDLVSYRVICDNESIRDTFISNIVNDDSIKVVIELTKEYLGSNTRPNGYRANQRTIKLESLGLTEIAGVTQKDEEFNQYGIIAAMDNNNYDKQRYKVKGLLVNGKLKFLPENSTALDIAIDYDSNLVNFIAEIKLNGKPVAFDQIVENSSNITVEYQSSNGFREDFLRSVNLPRSIEILNSAIALEYRQQIINNGINKLRLILKDYGCYELHHLGLDFANHYIIQYFKGHLSNFYLLLGQDGYESIQKVFESKLKDRVVELAKNNTYLLRVDGQDRTGILNEIIKDFEVKNINIERLGLRNNDGIFTLYFRITGISSEDIPGLTQRISDANVGEVHIGGMT